MTAVTIKAHFDGQQIKLDEPVAIPTDAKLIVTILPNDDDADFQRNWAELSLHTLSAAYGDDEPEYSATDLKP